MAEQCTPTIAISRTTSDPEAESSINCPTPSPKRPPKPRVSTSPVSSQFKQSKRTDNWANHTGSAGVQWHKHWTQRSFPNGRVLLIDYISSVRTPEDDPEDGRRDKRLAVAAQEFENLDELRGFYASPRRLKQAALRVIHVQNATWAVEHLLKRFNIDHSSELVGMEGFSKWARYERPRQRNGKPFPSGRSWRTQMDPWRNVNRTAFGLDYLKHYHTTPPLAKDGRPDQRLCKQRDAHFMHLDAYEDSKSPEGYDISVQRLSVYVQRNLGAPGRISPDDDENSPYAQLEADGHGKGFAGKNPTMAFEVLDNSNTIIVFETSASRMLEDCLAQPRNDFENRWRRLSFFLSKEGPLDDHRLATKCANIVLNDIFHGLAIVWEDFLNAASDHVSLLEEKIYDNPADESRAPDLWTNQAAWLKVDKVMYLHKDLIAQLQGHLKVLTEDQELQEEWLAVSTAELEKLGHGVEEDLARATNNLSDLVYKSVGIRDSRQSLQLGLSMWRLSWITFIFLPLTFIVGFFGMNVSLFEHFPDVKWYFLAAIVTLLLVVMLWFGVKHSLQQHRQSAYQRGVYERLFNQLSDEHPHLWSQHGARDDIEVEQTSRLKWNLLRRWFSPQKTVDKRLYHSLDPDAALGSWSAFKRYLLRRWLAQIRLRRRGTVDPLSSAELAGSSAGFDDRSPVATELVRMSSPVLMAGAGPIAAQKVSRYRLRPVNSAGEGSSDESPPSRGSSGLMIEERNLSDSENDSGRDADAAPGASIR